MMFERMKEDIAVVFEQDPAATEQTRSYFNICRFTCNLESPNCTCII